MRNSLPILALGAGAFAAPAPGFWPFGEQDSITTSDSPFVQAQSTYCAKPTKFQHGGHEYTATKPGWFTWSETIYFNGQTSSQNPSATETAKPVTTSAVCSASTQYITVTGLPAVCSTAIQYVTVTGSPAVVSAATQYVTLIVTETAPCSSTSKESISVLNSAETKTTPVVYATTDKNTPSPSKDTIQPSTKIDQSWGYNNQETSDTWKAPSTTSVWGQPSKSEKGTSVQPTVSSSKASSSPVKPSVTANYDYSLPSKSVVSSSPVKPTEASSTWSSPAKPSSTSKTSPFTVKLTGSAKTSSEGSYDYTLPSESVAISFPIKPTEAPSTKASSSPTKPSATAKTSSEGSYDNPLPPKSVAISSPVKPIEVPSTKASSSSTKPSATPKTSSEGGYDYPLPSRSVAISFPVNLTGLISTWSALTKPTVTSFKASSTVKPTNFAKTLSSANDYDYGVPSSSTPVIPSATLAIKSTAAWPANGAY